MLPCERSTLIFFVNGKKVVDNNVDPEWTLLYYLRNKLRLCGTKLGCAEGGCGACTVMISKYDRAQGKLIHMSINSCLAPVCSMHGLAITTVEGIGNTKTRLHPVQERIAKAHGSQCGFCTPGIVMSMYTLLRNLPKPTMHDLETALQGNLCRCTGYRPIIEGFKTFTKDYELMRQCQISCQPANGCSMGDKCCKFNSSEKSLAEGTVDPSDIQDVLFHPYEFAPYDPTQEPIFPPELKVSDKYDKEPLFFQGQYITWYRPTNLEQLLELKSAHPEAKIVCGNTEIGVEVKFKGCTYPILISPSLVEELSEIQTTDEGVKIGASVTLDQIEKTLKILINKEPEEKTQIFRHFNDMLHWFASRQIRDVATVGGNIITGSPISDLVPILMACEAEMHFRSKNKERTIKMTRGFFTGYRKNILDEDEVLISFTLPYTDKNQHFYAYKQARRREDDIAIVNAAVNVIFKNNVIDKINLAFGGMAPTTVDAPKTSAGLKGLSWNKEMLDKALCLLAEDLPLGPDAPGGMIDYRKCLTLSFFFKTYLSILKCLPGGVVDEKELSGIKNLTKNTPQSSQYFASSKERECYDPVGRPTLHASALKQACGEAIYVDDMPQFKDELYMTLVTSTKSHAKIINIDASKALEMKGVRKFICAKDLTGIRNKMGPVVQDEEIFVSDVTTGEGQLLGMILAEDKYTAQRAARKVEVTYEELSPVIVSIEDAIENNSFFPNMPYKIICGDVDKVFEEVPDVLEGECRIGGQEHFYLETQCVLVNPRNEDNEMEIYSSTQHPSEISHLIGQALGIPENRIVTKVKRLGGGFGGKESKSALLAVPAAIAASQLGVPIRCMLDRDEDMMMTAGRNPFLMKYKVAFDKTGKILACEMYLYCNAGHSQDLSVAVMQRALMHMQNAYKVPNVRALGYVCKTNLHSHTAFRGFGAPQAMLAAECMMRDVATYLKADVVELSRLNLYQEGDLTHYNQKLEHCTLLRCWDECVSSSQFQQRRTLIEEFNKENRWKKRGMAILPTAFGIAFTIPFLNQAGALVLIYTDGSVLLTHGGVEMGQGLHTKMLQIASKVLEIPQSKIHIVETATDKIPNTSPSAASVSSDLNGPAIMQACETLKKRLLPFKEKNPNGKWEDWVKEAYLNSVSLSASGFYRTPCISFDWDTGEGTPFNYFVYGVACTEVEIDCLTGDHSILRTDIVMDIGESLNPAIDVGQIEGAFVQGYGLYVLEEVVYSSKGNVFTKGPGAYKIPGFGDIPMQFNVSVLKGAPNPRAIYSSKAVGEPPLFLSCSVFFAIKEAILAARKESGVADKPFEFNAPATCAKIRMACSDFLTEKIKPAKPGTFTPWNVVP